MKTAMQWLDDLECGTAQAFPNIKRADVASGLRARLALPTRINQGNTSLCGPASLLYSVASARVEAYAQYVVELYQTGRGSLGRLTVEPGSDCRRYAADPAKGIHPVDWVALASLRDSQNDFLDYDGPSDEAGGVTMPGDLVDWFKDAGFSKDANYTNFVFTKDVKNLAAAGNRFAQGHSVCLFINSNMLGKAHEESWFPDHWVVLASPVAFANGNATFSVYTWGTLRTISLTPKVLCENLYGYISSSPK